MEGKLQRADELVFGLEFGREAIVIGLIDTLAGEVVLDLLIRIGAMGGVGELDVIGGFDGIAVLVELAAEIVDTGDIKDEGASLELVIVAGVHDDRDFGGTLVGDALVGLDEGR